MEEYSINHFSISSGPIVSNPEAYIAALRNAAQCLRNEHPNVHVNSIHAIEAYHGNMPTDDSVISLFVTYWASKSDAPVKRGASLPFIDYRSPDSISILEIRLPSSYDNSPAEDLLAKTANEIEKLGDCEILDLIYQDYVDKEGNEQPFIRLYYTSKELAQRIFNYA